MTGDGTGADASSGADPTADPTAGAGADPTANVETNYNEQILQKQREMQSSITNYGTAYTNYLTEKFAEPNELNNLRGKTIKYENKVYFVNNHGVARELPMSKSGAASVDAFLKTGKWKAFECDTPEPVTKEIFDALTTTNAAVLKMNWDTAKKVWEGQKCSDPEIVEGQKLLRDKTSKDVFWLDHLGMKHKVSDTNNIPGDCGDIKGEIDGIRMGLIEDSGQALTKCETHMKSSNLHLVNKLNNDIKNKAIETKSIIMNMLDSNNNLDNNIVANSESYTEKKNKLLDDRKKIKSLEKEILSLDGNVRDNFLSVKSVNLNYLAWGISLVTFAGITIMMTKK